MRTAQLVSTTILAGSLLAVPAVAQGLLDPDLQIPSMASPSSAVAGTEIQLSVRFANRGRGRADSFFAELWLEERVTGRPPLATKRWRVRDLAPGEDVQELPVLRVPASLTAGSYSLRVLADRDLDVSESNEANNVSVRSIQITATSTGPTPPPQAAPAGPGTVMAPPRDLRADLAVELESLGPASGLPGQSVNGHAWVTNSGNVTLLPSTVSLVLRPGMGSQTVLESVSVSRLSPGERRRVSFRQPTPADLVPGRYTLLVKADSDNAFAEVDETNNEAGILFVVTGPDLRPGPISVHPGTVAPGGLFNLESSFYSNRHPSVPRIPLRVVLSASRSLSSPTVLFDGATMFPRPDCSSADSSCYTHNAPYAVPANTAPGTWYVAVLLDPDNVIAEQNERNNTVGPLALEVQR